MARRSQGRAITFTFWEQTLHDARQIQLTEARLRRGGSAIANESHSPRGRCGRYESGEPKLDNTHDGSIIRPSSVEGSIRADAQRKSSNASFEARSLWVRRTRLSFIWKMRSKNYMHGSQNRIGEGNARKEERKRH